MTFVLIWGMVATAIYWNLRHVRFLQTPDHVKVVAVLWPLAILSVVIWGIWKIFHLGTKHVVVGTVVSFKNVADNYRYGSLLPVKASKGNALDSFDKEANEEVGQLLKVEE